MKQLLTTALILTALTIQAQFVQPEPKPIDLKLEQFRKEHAFGTGMQIVGAAICALGYFTQKTNGKLSEPFYAMGGAIVLGGTITRMVSYRHLTIDNQVK